MRKSLEFTEQDRGAIDLYEPSLYGMRREKQWGTDYYVGKADQEVGDEVREVVVVVEADAYMAALSDYFGDEEEVGWGSGWLIEKELGGTYAEQVHIFDTMSDYKAWAVTRMAPSVSAPYWPNYQRRRGFAQQVQYKAEHYSVAVDKQDWSLERDNIWSSRAKLISNQKMNRFVAERLAQIAELPDRQIGPAALALYQEVLTIGDEARKISDAINKAKLTTYNAEGQYWAGMLEGCNYILRDLFRTFRLSVRLKQRFAHRV